MILMHNHNLEKNPMWKGGLCQKKWITICQICGKQFFSKFIRHYLSKTCSKRCHDKLSTMKWSKARFGKTKFNDKGCERMSRSKIGKSRPENVRLAISEKGKNWFKNENNYLNWKRNHSKAMLSFKWTEEMMQKRRKTQMHTIWKDKKFEYKGIYFKSSWEQMVAKLMDRLNIEWLYEPKIFKVDKYFYTPDFYLPELNLWLEVKGYQSDAFKTKWNFFKLFFPTAKLLCNNITFEDDLRCLL